jgi:hypothetical protein
LLSSLSRYTTNGQRTTAAARTPGTRRTHTWPSGGAGNRVGKSSSNNNDAQEADVTLWRWRVRGVSAADDQVRARRFELEPLHLVKPVENRHHRCLEGQHHAPRPPARRGGVRSYVEIRHIIRGVAHVGACMVYCCVAYYKKYHAHPYHAYTCTHTKGSSVSGLCAIQVLATES